MKHVTLRKPGLLEFGESPEPVRAEGEALVRVRRVGVCGTDIHAFHGRQPFFEYPRIPGHELGVEVLEAPAESGLKTGDLCAVRPYLHDPSSQASRAGKTNCCESLQVLGVHTDGGLRPEIVLPVDLLHRSTTLSVDALALVETLCIGAHATTRSGVGAKDRVAIIGAGPIGLTVLEFVRQRTELPIAVLDVNEHRLRFAEEGGGPVSGVHLPSTPDLPAALRNLWGGDLPSIILDATGNARSMAGTFDLVAHGGTIVFVGLFQGDLSFHDPTFHRKELTLKASRNGTAEDFRVVLDALESGSVDTERWLSHRLAFGEVPDQFAEMIAQPDLVKAVIDLDGE